MTHIGMGIGGTGVTTINLLHNDFALGEELAAAGLQLLGVDGLRDDKRVLIKPGATGIDTGPASPAFILSASDVKPTLERASASPKPLPNMPWLDQDDARQLRDSPPPEFTAAGTSRVLSTIAAELGLPAAVRTLSQALDTAQANRPGNDSPPTVFVIFGSGGTGPGHALPYLRKLRKLGGASLQIWAFIVAPGPFERYFVSDPDQIVEMRARFVATIREIDGLPPGVVNFTHVIGDGPGAYAASEPVDGVLAALATGIEGWVRENGVFKPAVAGFAVGDLGGVKAHERHSTLGAAALSYPAGPYAHLIAAREAQECWRRMVTLTPEDSTRVRALVDSVASGIDPVRLAVEVAAEPMGEMPSCALFEVQAIEQLEMRLAAEGEFRPPLVPVFDEVPTPRMGSASANDVIAAANRELNNYMEDFGQWSAANREALGRDMTEYVRRQLEAELSGPPESGRSLADAPVVARIEAALEALTTQVRQAGDRVESSVEEISDATDPVGTAQRYVDEAAAAMGDVARRKAIVRYIEAMRALAFAQRWAGIERAAVATWRDLAATLDTVRRMPDKLLLEARRFAEHEAEQAAMCSDRIRAVSARPSTAIVPVIDSPGETELQRTIVERLARDGRDLPATLLSRLGVQAIVPAGTPVSEWDLRLITPQIPGFVAARTTDALAADGGHERVSALAPGFMGVMALSEVEPACRALTVYDALAIEYRTAFPPEKGGNLTQAAVEDFLRPYCTELFSASEPLAKIETTSLDGRLVADPVRHEFAFADARPPGDELGVLIRDSLKSALPGVHDGADTVIRRVIIVNRVALSRLPEHHEAVAAYHQAKKPLHTNRAAKFAWRLERTAIAAGRLEDGRLLDQTVVNLLEHPKALRAAASLLALGKLEVRADPDDVDRRLYTIRVDRNGHSDSVDLGETSDPGGALREAIVGSHGEFTRPALEHSWERLRGLLEQELGGDDAVREHRSDAVRALALPPSETIDVSDLSLVLDLMIGRRTPTAV